MKTHTLLLPLVPLTILAVVFSYLAHQSGLTWAYSIPQGLGSTMLVFVLTYPLMKILDRVVHALLQNGHQGPNSAHPH